jgi:hypothetical protein
MVASSLVRWRSVKAAPAGTRLGLHVATRVPRASDPAWSSEAGWIRPLGACDSLQRLDHREFPNGILFQLTGVGNAGCTVAVRGSAEWW